MAATDVQDTLNLALAATGVTQVQVRHRPRLLSDNGPAYVSEQLASFLKQYDITHVHGKPFYLQTQGKIERYHRSLKSLLCLENFYFPGNWSRRLTPSSTTTIIIATMKHLITSHLLIGISVVQPTSLTSAPRSNTEPWPYGALNICWLPRQPNF